MQKSFITDVWYGSEHTLGVVQDSKINLKWISAKKLEKTVHFLNMDLARNTLRRDTQDIRSNSLQMFYQTALLKNYAKIYSNASAPEAFFQLATCNFTEKETSAYIFFREFCKIFRKNFITEKLLRIGFESRILWKMANRHSYDKEISLKSTALSKNADCKGKGIFENHWSNVDSNSNFQLLHRYFFSKGFY